jgi:hypothetical protein
MGLNRFSTTGTSEYTPQHVPLPFDTISKLGEQVKLEHDTADAQLAAKKTDIQGGLATQEHAKALNAKKNTMLQEAQTRAEKTGNYGRLTQDIVEIGSVVQNDPLFQGIQRDIAQTERANKQRFDPNLQYTVQGFADEKGNVKQLGVDQPFDESYYNVVAPGNTNKEYNPLFEQIKPILTKAYEDPVTKIYTDANGNTHTEILQEGVEAEGLKRERVRQTLAEYIKNDPNALNQPSRFYSDALSKKQRGIGLTKDEHLDEIANSWLGEYYNQKDIQKFSEKITPAKKGSTSDGGGTGTEGEGIPNAYTGMLDAPVVTDENLDGLYRKNDDGSHTVPLEGSIMNFAEVSNLSPEENKVMTLGQTQSKLKSKFKVSDVDDAKEVLEKQNPKFKYDAGVSGERYMTEDGKKAVLITTFPSINYTKEELAQTGVKSLDEISNILLKSSSDYSFLKESAKADGIDIESPKFQETYKKGLGKYTEEVNAELGNILEIGGEGNFVVDQGNNRINVDGKPFLSGKVIKTHDQLTAAFDQVGKGHNDWDPTDLRDDWEDIYLKPNGSGYGLIKPYGTDKDGKQLYAISIKKEIPVSRAINKTYNKNVYTSEYTKNANNLDKSFDEFAGNNFRRREQEVYESIYTNNKKSFDENLNKQIESNSQYKPQLTTILNEINAEKDPNKKKEKIINFSLILKQGGAEDIIKSYTEASQPTTEGKSQGGWSQTPATPLSK